MSNILAQIKSHLHHQKILETTPVFVTSPPLPEPSSLRRHAIEEKFVMILDSISDAVIAVDMDKNAVLINQATTRLLGLPESQIINQPIGNLFKLEAEGKQITQDTYCPVTNVGLEEIVFDKKGIKITNNQGTQFYVNITARHIKDGINSNMGCILTFRDSTAEKQLELMKLDFVSMAAHELRTPLTTIKGYLSVFMQENDKTLTNDQKMFMNKINFSAQQLMSLVENLLNVSRIERGAFAMFKEKIDWVSLVHQTVNEFLDRAKEKNIHLEFIEPTKEIPKITADKLRITEVLYNLIGNALTYTQPGGSILVSVAFENKVITHVADTGQGIPKDALSRLFTKFYRVSGRTESGSKGTGLGLYISKEIITIHGGEIWVDSELGKGTTFSFSLPPALVDPNSAFDSLKLTT